MTSVGDLGPSSALGRAARSGSCKESRTGLPPMGGAWTVPCVESVPGLFVWASSDASEKFENALSSRQPSTSRGAGCTHLSDCGGPGSTSARRRRDIDVLPPSSSSSESASPPGLDTCTTAFILTSEPFEPFGTRGGESVTSRCESVPQPSPRGMALWRPCWAVVLRAKLSERAPAPREWTRLPPLVMTE